MSTYRVLITAPYMLPVVERFRPVFAENGIEAVVADVEERMEEDDLLPIIAEYDGIICGDDRFTPRVLDAAAKLKVISKWGTGIDSIDVEAARERGIRVCRTPDAFTHPVADSTLGYMLAFARRQPWIDREMKAGVWAKLPGFAMNEATVGVVGVGAIGCATLRRSKPFGSTLLGTDIREIDPALVNELGVEMVSFETLLERSDFVCLHCDLNPTSHHLMNAAAFDRMKPTAVVLNLARGTGHRREGPCRCASIGLYRRRRHGRVRRRTASGRQPVAVHGQRYAGAAQQQLQPQGL
jgi:D-3-phosphoglycerate dehydrogenase